MTMSIPEEIDSLISSIEQLVSDDDQEALRQAGLRLRTLIRADRQADPTTLAQHLETLASVHYSLGELERAAEYLSEALAVLDELDPASPFMIQLLDIIASVTENLGRPHEELGYRRRLVAMQRAAEPDSPDVLLEMRKVARLEHVTGNFAEAARIYQELIAACQRVHGPRSRQTAISLTD